MRGVQAEADRGFDGESEGMAIKDEGAVGGQKSLPFKSAEREQGQIFCATKSRERI